MSRGIHKAGLALLIVATVATFASAQTITNPGYEQGGGSLAGWTSFLLAGKTGGVAILNPSTHNPNPYNHGGSNHAGNSDGGSGFLVGGGMYQVVSGLTAGTEYEVGFYGTVRATDFSGVPYEGDDFLSLYWINGTGNFGSGLPASAQLLDQAVSPVQDWTLFSGRFTPTGTSATVVVTWDFGGSAWVANSSHVDDWSIASGALPPTSTPTASPTATPTATCPADPSDALVNGSFETGIEPWVAFGSTGQQETEDYFGVLNFHGNYFYGVARNGVVSDGGRYQKMTWCGGNTAVASVWINTINTTTTQQGNRIGIDPLGGSNPGAASVVWSSYARSDAGWTQIDTGNVAVTPNSTITVFLQHDQESGAGSYWNINAFDLAEIGGTVNPTPPTVAPTVTNTPEFPPCDSDIDGDTVCDDVESLDKAPAPGVSNKYLPDSDGDGLNDGEEDVNRDGASGIALGETSTRNRNSDADSVNDGIEVLFLGTDPLDQNDPVSAPADVDQDELPASLDPDDGDIDTDSDRYLDGFDATWFADAGAANDAGQKPSLGNVDGLGGVDNGDSQLILNFFGNQAVTETFDFTLTDVNRDAFIDNGDSQLTLQFFGNAIPVLPFRQ